MCNTCLSRVPLVLWANVEDNPLLRALWSRHAVEAAGSAFYYVPSSDFHNLFIMFKYGHRPTVGQYLARISFPRWYALGLARGACCIVPVPLSRIRRWHRGYNQAEWIARGISQVTGIPVCASVLRRTRNNSTQTHLTAQERLDNTRDLFAVHTKSPDLNGKTILLVDDIFTTGATLSDCIRALRKAYPTVRVHLFTLGWAGDR